MKTRTKIICTMGPAVRELDQMVQLIENGMDVARLNFSHGTHEEHQETIRRLKEARKICNRPMSILLDTKGPEIRTGAVKEKGISVKKGDTLLLVKEVVEGDEKRLNIRPPIVLDYLKIGTMVLIDNGYIQSRVVSISDEGVVVQFENDGVILSSKGVNIPDIEVPLPTLTEKDIDDIRFGCEQGIEIIAASFIRNADNVLDIKRLLSQYKRPEVLVLAKIENTEGINSFDGILQVADGVMVARGDLGVEVPLSQVPRFQKMMIRKCNLAGKPVVTATQMLESMMHNPRPTRAEVSDVANAIYDGTSAVMLSGETAVGNYPQETVKLMKSVAAEAEKDFNYQAYFDVQAKVPCSGITSAITLATVKTAHSLDAKAIFTFTRCGSTARLLSRLKPEMLIIAITKNEVTYHQLALSWGVIPVISDINYTTGEEAFMVAAKWGVAHGIVSDGDLVVLTVGSPFLMRGTTNTIIVDSIGDVLLRGSKGIGERVQGEVVLVSGDFVAHPEEVRGRIIVLPTFDETQAPLVREAAGVILQNSPEDKASEHFLEEVCVREKKTAIFCVDGAFRILKEKQLVWLDPQKGIVYKGTL